MKKLFLILIFALSAFHYASAQLPLPSVSLERQNGEPIDAASLADGEIPTVMYFWFYENCRPCILGLGWIYEAMPGWLNEADFRMVAVSIDYSESLNKAKAIVEEKGWSSRITFVYDVNHELADTLGLNGGPASLVVDKNGIIHPCKVPHAEGVGIEIFPCAPYLFPKIRYFCSHDIFPPFISVYI